MISIPRTWHPYLPAGVVLLLGLMLTAGSANYLRDQEEAELRGDFQSHADHVSEHIESYFNERLHGVAGVAALFDANPALSVQQFDVFTNSLRRLHPHIQAFEWAPRVAAEERAAFEAHQRQRHPGYAIRTLVAPADDGVSFPLTYVNAVAGEAQAMGVDMASEPRRRKALELARDSGQIALSARIRLSQIHPGEDGLLCVAAVYRQGAPRGTVAERRAALKGYVIGVLRLADLLGSDLATRVHAPLDLHIEDHTPGEPAVFLFHQTADGMQYFDPNEGGHMARLRAVRQGLSREKRLFVDGRVWSLHYQAGFGAYQSTGRDAKWALGLGLALSLGLAAYLALLGNRRLRLEESEARARATFEQAAVGVAHVNARTGRFLRVNAGFCRMLGYSMDELLRLSVVDITHPDDHHVDEARMRELTAGQIDHFSLEKRYLHRDGHVVWGNVTVSSVLDAQGRPDYHIAMVQDISRRKAAEQALMQERDINRRYLDTTQTFMLALDGQGCISMINRKGCELLGRSEAALLGQNWFATCLPQPEGMRDVYPVFERIMAGELAAAEHFENSILCADGRQRLMAWANAYLKDADGRIVGTLSSGEDITELRALERQSAALAAQTRQILESAGEGIFGLDCDGRVTFANPAAARLLGYTQEELLGLPGHDTWHHHYRDGEPYPDDACPIRTTLCNGSQFSGEEWFIRKDGSHFAVLYSSNPLYLDGRISGAVVAFSDISQMKLHEERLRLADTLFSHSAEGVMVTDPEANLVAVNPAFSRITGYSEAEVLGRNPRFLQSGRQGRDYYQELWSRLQQNGYWRGEIWNRRKDGAIYPELLTISAVRDDTGRLVNYVGVLSDISDIKHAQEELDFLAHHDPLTALPNRNLFNELLRQAMQRAHRTQGRVALLFMDLDRFKDINDSLGHPVGDRLLVEVAQRLKAELRSEDAVSRIGGDEFNIVLENLSDPQEAGALATRLLAAVSAPFEIEGRCLYIGASIGIAIYPLDGEDIATLNRNADTALYQAKAEGRNTYRYFAKALAEKAIERQAMETLLRQALETGQLELHYQPQVALVDGRTLGVEALARWHSPVLGEISPARFIPLAEETGLIVELGAWAIQTACRQMRQWREAGSEIGYVAVNVSAVQLNRGDLVSVVRSALSESGLKPGELELEITESFVMGDPAAAAQVLEELKGLGVSLAIDDFGTGYSSLAYLKRMPLNRLKVDQGFVRGMLEDDNDASIVLSVIALGHSLGLEVLAEGVETAAQAEVLRKMGCDAAQGWLYGKAVSAEALNP